MRPTQSMMLDFYQNLGKLFYAIAAADKVVREIEVSKLKKMVKSDWLKRDTVNDEFNTNAAFQIEIVFDWLYSKDYKAETCFEDFIAYKEMHPSLFTEDIKKHILKTASVIAASFSGINKSELIMLVKLDLEFKK